MEKKNTGTDFAVKRLRVPNTQILEMFGKVIQLMGVNNIQIICEDGKERICRIPGKMFKHIWLKPGDIVIIKLWDFQPTKGDVVWRYIGFQITQLEKRGLMTELYKHTHDTIHQDNYRGYYNAPKEVAPEEEIVLVTEDPDEKS
ncbi:MAG: translation initiation factor eIF-1A [archaeon]